MKRLTNKVLVALSLLSVAGPVFGKDSTLSAGIDKGLKGLSDSAFGNEVVYATGSAFGNDSTLSTEVNAGLGGLSEVAAREADAIEVGMDKVLKRLLLLEEAKDKTKLLHYAKHYPRLLLSVANDSSEVRDLCLAAGVDLTSLGVNEGLRGLSKIADWKICSRHRAKYSPEAVLWQVYHSPFERDLHFAAGLDLNSLKVTIGLKCLSEVAEEQFNTGIDKGFSGLSDLAKTLSTSTLLKRLDEVSKRLESKHALKTVPYNELRAKMFDNIQGVTVDDIKAAFPGENYRHPRDISWVDCLKSSITFEDYVKNLKLQGATELPFIYPHEVAKRLESEHAVKAVFDFLKPLAEQGANARIDVGLGGLSDLAKELSTSTLSERLAMKNGLVNKVQEIIHTVGAGKLALGATAAIAGAGLLYKLYNSKSAKAGKNNS